MVTPKKKSPVGPKVQKVMHEFKGKTLHSGKGGPVVTSRKQAIAIALSEQSKANKKKTHRMPNGKMMEGPRHEKSEGPAARMKEYGSKTGGVKPAKKRK